MNILSGISVCETCISESIRVSCAFFYGPLSCLVCLSCHILVCLFLFYIVTVYFRCLFYFNV